MNYKIVSNNKDLISQASNVFASLDMNEAIHIQEVDFWLIDTNTLDKNSILSYKNKNEYSNLLFVVNNDEEIQICLQNSFSNYINSSFTNLELNSWCKYFLSLRKTNIVDIDENTSIDLDNKVLYESNKSIKLTLQEIALLNAINSKSYVPTENIATVLNLSSTTSVRTIINRIRKKLSSNVIEHKRHLGYKLAKTEQKSPYNQNINSHIKELEEQNNLMQEIVDSSPIFIVTFVHKQLYCINKSFRDFLGVEIVKELWDETKGDFFQLIKHNSKDKESLKQRLFCIGTNNIELYDFHKNDTNKFEIKTYYFENLDKHLLIFEKK